MSDLTRMIKDMKGFEVDNGKHFNQYYIDVWTNNNKVPKESQVLYMDKDPRNTQGIFIAGYDEADEFGAGNTRVLPHARYRLHMFATKTDTKLSHLFETEFEKRLLQYLGIKSQNDISAIKSIIAEDNALPKAKPEINDGILMFDGTGVNFSYNGQKEFMFAGALITNVHRK